MRFTNFTGGCLGKVFVVLLCILLGVVLTIGAIIGGGYIVLTRKGMMGTVQDFANSQNVNINFDDAILDLSILEWIREVAPTFNNFASVPIGEIESLMGMEALSQNICDITGIEIDIIKESTLREFGTTFSENMTVITASEKFGIEFPDLPVFQDQSFLQSPLTTAFSKISDFEISAFVEIDETSSPILQNIADLKISQLSDPEEGIDKKINSLKLKEVITIEEEGENKSSVILIRLQDTLVGELGSSETHDTIMSMTLEEVIDISEEHSSPALWELRETPIGELGSSQTDDKIKNMEIADLMTIDEQSSNILQYFASNNVTLAGTDEYGNSTGIDQALKTMTLKDMITLTDPDLPGGSVKFLWVLRNCPLQTIPADDDNPEILGIEDKLKITPLSELLDISDSHIWQYLGNATIEDIGEKVDEMAITDAIEITVDSPPILRKMRKAKEDEDATLFGEEDIKINELDEKLEPLILDLELGEILNIDESSEPILITLKNIKIGGMNDAISNLTIQDVFRPDVYNGGALSLLDAQTPISNISSQIITVTENSRLQKLINLNIVHDPNIFNIELKAGIKNQMLNDILNSYSAILNDALNHQTPSIGNLMPDRIILDENICQGREEINMDFLHNLAEEHGFKEGDTLVLQKDMTIAPEDFYTLFNIITNSYTLEIKPGATIRSAEYNSDTEAYSNDKGGYMFLSNDFHDDSLLEGIFVGGGQVIGEFANPEDISIPNEIEVEVHP